MKVIKRDSPEMVGFLFQHIMGSLCEVPFTYTHGDAMNAALYAVAEIEDLRNRAKAMEQNAGALRRESARKWLERQNLIHAQVKS